MLLSHGKICYTIAIINGKKIVSEMPIYYCLDCKKVIFSKGGDYGPICPACKQKRKLKT
ncbi:protein of unknown function [Nitrosotalea devaniterrae]|uniref:Uncharacterized protein n=1 Tax=Nitrosotalea devaniterrae TaxID=1078905 RepID=A0A128A4M0_9ARCH|nr:protein of unknown function [Candidatus Nitrosotalea devanaterra]